MPKFDIRTVETWRTHVLYCDVEGETKDQALARIMLGCIDPTDHDHMNEGPLANGNSFVAGLEVDEAQTDWAMPEQTEAPPLPALVYVLLRVYGGVVDDVKVYANKDEAEDLYYLFWYENHDFSSDEEIEDYRRETMREDSCIMFTAEVE